MPQIALGAEDRTEEQQALRTELRKVLAKLWNDDLTREFADGDTTTSAVLTSVLDDDMALGTLTVPEELGGQGGGCTEAAIAAEETGAALAPSRLLATTMSAHLLRAGRDAALDRLQRRVLDEGVRVAAVWPADDATWDIGRISPVVVGDGVVTGGFRYAAELVGSSVFLLPARRGDELGLVVLDAEAKSGVDLEPTRSADVLRPLARLALSVDDHEWVAVEEPRRIFTETVALGAIVLAAEMIGTARTCIERMATYAGQRRQFGRTIGSFQALRHQIVAALVEWEAARALTYRAAGAFDALVRGELTVEELEPIARMAKAAAADALGKAAKDCIHVFGAIGFTWENPVHIALKRWASSAQVYGSPTEQRVRVCQHAIISSTGRLARTAGSR